MKAKCGVRSQVAHSRRMSFRLGTRRQKPFSTAARTGGLLNERPCIYIVYFFVGQSAAGGDIHYRTYNDGVKPDKK